jgi:tRNA A37 threonylcarbamoyladenosine dehydratase
LRNKFKHAKRFPAKKFQCVFSDELLTNQGLDDGSETLLYNKVQTNGSIAHITAIFGFTLAGLVIKNCAQMTNDK